MSSRPIEGVATHPRAALGLCLALCACADASYGEPPRLNEAWQGEAVAYETRTFERSVGECGDSDAASCARVFLEYPEVVRAPTEESRRMLNEAVGQILLVVTLDGSASAMSPEGLATEFLAAFAEARDARADASSPERWSLERRVKVVANDARVFSIASAEYVYTGGAHPNSSKRLASFDPVTGRRLELSDLFAPGFERRLNEIAEARFRRIHGVPVGTPLADRGFWFESDVFAVNGNFAVTAAGLTFYFNPYEVAPYAVGPTELVLTREELADLVRAGGPLDLAGAGT